MSDSNKSGFSVGFLHLLTLLFIGLKLTGYIAWSWWWVLSPIWLPRAVIIGVIIFVALVAVILTSIGFLIDEINRRR